jgi:3-deoxy-manno-octulosonate cytidylyltransferase (CMP-KDO synthetase)
MFFSREPIPTQKFDLNVPMKKQVCIIPFTKQFLIDYQNMDPTPLEMVESIDMMRVLENGFNVKMIPTNFTTSAVDTKEDLLRVQDLMSEVK